METLGIILLFIGAILVFGTFMVSTVDNPFKRGNQYIILFIISLLLLIIGNTIYQLSKKPVKGITPLDVYRGNTELQVNYKVINNDTIVTDSIVVWKQ